MGSRGADTLSLHARSTELSSIPESSDGFLYTCQTKYTVSIHARMQYSLLENIEVGDFVIIEADRGETLGIIVNKIPVEEFKQNFLAGPRGKVFLAHPTFMIISNLFIYYQQQNLAEWIKPRQEKTDTSCYE